MKKSFIPSFLSFLFVLALAIVWSCSKKEDTKPVVTAPKNVTTSAATNITPTEATLAGSVGSTGGESLSAVGIVYSSTNPDPTIQTEPTMLASAPEVGTFSVTLTGLDSKTKYYAKAFATNVVGTTYGALINFTTGTGVSFPVVASNASVSSITQTSASFGGNVSADGGSPVTERGVCWNTAGNPTVSLSTKTSDGSGTGSFTSSLTGLTAGTAYKVRAYATNANGTAYGNEVSFSTTAAPSTVSITFRVNMSNETVGAQGVHIAGDFLSPAWSPADGAMTNVGGGIWSYTAQVSQNTSIQYKFINGNAWGNNESLPAPCGTSPDGNRTLNVGTSSQTVTFCYNSCSGSCPSVTDIDGNVYPIVKIGTQTWMKTNLKTSKYRDGSAIPTGLSDNQWGFATTGAYAIFDNNPGNNTTYGKLYNGHAVLDSRNLCPAGWHVPSDAEWTTLENFLGGASVAGGKLKSTTGWDAPNTGATNESGFSALPGGFRNSGNYWEMGYSGKWWSSTVFDSDFIFYRSLEKSYSNSDRSSSDKSLGYSVRCIKD